MILVISLLLVAQGVGSRWDSPDILIEDSLGPYVDFAADYNYSNGNIYVACIPDSGTYFGPDSMGILLFRSDDHGETWDMIFRDAYQAQYWELKEIDLVATRNDTVYVLMSWYHEVPENDQLNIAKIWGGGGMWSIDWLMTTAINATEIRSPKLVRDDFDDFYLYIAYLDITTENDSLIILRSEDRGYNWSNLLRASSAAEWQDQDIAVADSSLYHLSTFQHFENQTMQVSSWRNRGISAGVTNLLELNTNSNGQIKYPRIGATTTLPDTTQLVYAFYSQEDSITGNYDLLYLHSQNGGADWDSVPDTLADESYSPVLCDLRGYEVAPNQWMDVTYCFTSSAPSFENLWCWSSEDEPTNWQGTASVGTGANRSVPELIYSPGAPGGGGAVVFNDSLGNLWFDAPWYSGISEDTDIIKKKIRSQIVPAGSTVEVCSAGATVYDVTGRAIKILNTNSWNLKDEEGKEVEGGIYFIVEKENGYRIKLSILR
jgi:hypothetical protein